MSADTAQPNPDYTHTLRITFAYDGPNLQIARVKRVAMRAPAAAAAPPQDNQVGYWLEVRDADGKLLYHRPIHNPMRRDIESFGHEPGAPLRRHATTADKGEFEVLVPDLPGAQSFRLHGPGETPPTAAMAAHTAASPSTVLTEHSLDELRRRAE